ncbi:nuclear receptor coactivator 7-like isoform X4 [Carcharodon carcharias]|uniref:nuclear receptor coactivator 7-like isoform X4 n=1 Tax=Carcharodon carcharias TaxID=13397 RepID=UPI001B7EB146|nr:nuclear receptor coactivator 7-like isoform X4 [Carcharodon carcharias]
MDTKDLKKERRPGYFARLLHMTSPYVSLCSLSLNLHWLKKKTKQLKQKEEEPSGCKADKPLHKIQVGQGVSEENINVTPLPSFDHERVMDNFKSSLKTGDNTAEDKRKTVQRKEIRRAELKSFYFSGDSQINNEKEKKMASQKPMGTTEYMAAPQDTLNTIALKFDVTPNELVQINRLFSRVVVPGQILLVPDTHSSPGAANSSGCGSPLTPPSSDAEYDKLPDADFARKVTARNFLCSPVHSQSIVRITSSGSEDDEPLTEKFLKMNCRYITDGEGVVGGVMIVTPNNIMFDPHKSDSLVIENGCEEYGLICPMEEVISIALYPDISHMKIKDALPSVDHLYAFFVQWSPEVYGKDAKDQGFVVVEKDELEVIDNFFSDPIPKSWEIITIEEAKRRQSIGSFYEEEAEDLEPVLADPSELLESFHIEKLTQHLPARTQGYAWRLMYSTAVHGTSLRTLYRSLAVVDTPVLLVVKDMDNQIFGALASHPFRLSDHCFGTGETFLYTFNPQFKIFRWSGENSYFIKGDRDSLELGGGSGHFGLWLDADLYHGRSNPCSTFNNETLSKKEDFIVQDLEVWTFV